MQNKTIIKAFGALRYLGQENHGKDVNSAILCNLTIIKEKVMDEYEELLKQNSGPENKIFKAEMAKLNSRYCFKNDSGRIEIVNGNVEVKPQYILRYERKLDRLEKKYPEEFEKKRNYESKLKIFGNRRVELELMKIPAGALKNVPASLLFDINFMLI